MDGTTLAEQAGDRRPALWQRRSVRAGVLAVAVTLLVQLVAAVQTKVAPFGPKTRNLNDLWNQFVPLHAHLRDLIFGVGPSDWQVNWNSGLGVPFVPDYSTYLSSPFAPLVALAPRDHVETAVWIICVLKTLVAAVAMTIYLRRLSTQGPWVVLGLLGASYGLSAWALDDASYVPMWLDGLYALPLLALVGEWARERRRPILSVIVVAVCWWANYYTGFMASMAAVLLTLTRAAGTGGWRDSAWTVVSFAWRGALGVALTGILLLPTVMAVGVAAPGAASPFYVRPWTTFAARLLPGTEGVGTTPSIGAGALALILALALPWCRALPIRVRVAYTSGIILILLSMQWAPTQAAWHGFDVPNGSPFRQAFVVAAWLVVMAWLAATTSGPPVWGWLIVALSLVALLALSRRQDAVTYSSIVTSSAMAVMIAAAVAMAVVTAVRTRAGRDPMRPVGRARARLNARAAGALALALIGAVVLESTGTAIVVRHRQAALLGAPAQNKWAPRATELAPWLPEGAAARDDWPAARTTYWGALSSNPSMLTGWLGPDYYSSSIPAEVSTALRGLGLESSGYGRMLRPTSDPALLQLFAIGWILEPQGAGASAPAMVRRPTFPVVRVLSAVAPYQAPAGTAFGQRNSLYATPPYEVPTASASDSRTGKSLALPLASSRSVRITLTASCRPGSTVQLEATSNHIVTTVGRRSLEFGPRTRSNSPQVGVVTVGTTPKDGQVSVTVSGVNRLGLSAHPLGCFDSAVASSAIATATGAGPVSIVGNRLRVGYSAPTTGDIVVATALTTGWSCQADSRDVPVGRRGGLMSLAVDGHRNVECRYQTPGLMAGSVVSGAALLALLVIALLTRRLRGSRREPDHAGM